MKKKKTIKVGIIVGTRPEIIKMSPVIRSFDKRGINYFLVNTAQHFDYVMSKVFFKELGISKPKYSLDISTGTHAEETAKMIVFIEKVLVKEKPDAVLIEGDTNTVLSAALAAVKLHINIGHVEAGLRSFDYRMPEEMNRILTDRMSNLLFAPTQQSERNLLVTGISKEKIFVVGNTIVDAVYQNMKLAAKPKKLEKKLGVKLIKNKYFLVTAHRPENVDSKEIMRDILSGFRLIHKKYSLPIIYPIHPRAKKMLKKFKLSTPKGVHLIDPIGYFDLLYLLGNARLVLTDSGGIQEEACVAKTPCVTFRISTERPETIWVGANIISGTKPTKILNCVDTMLERGRSWENPLGDGKTGEKITDILLKSL